MAQMAMGLHNMLHATIKRLLFQSLRDTLSILALPKVEEEKTSS